MYILVSDSVEKLHCKPRLHIMLSFDTFEMLKCSIIYAMTIVTIDEIIAITHLD